MDPALIALWAGAILVIAVAIFWTPERGDEFSNEGGTDFGGADEGGHHDAGH